MICMKTFNKKCVVCLGLRKLLDIYLFAIFWPTQSIKSLNLSNPKAKGRNQYERTILDKFILCLGNIHG